MENDSKKIIFDSKSFRNLTLRYFIIFAGIILLMIWLLRAFFMDNYYEQMKAQETQLATEQLAREYQVSREVFSNNAASISVNNGIFIRLNDKNGSIIYDSGNVIDPSTDLFNREMTLAFKTLMDSSMDSISIKATDTSNASRLVYASRIYGHDGEAFLFVIAPLVPVQSTIAIMQRQLAYTSIIALIVAIILAYFISDMLTKPIAGITKSAMELSRGNYNVKFNGGGITETNELAKILNEASYEMQKTEYYQRDLLANVSHDLKTPLTMIKSYAEMIHDISGDNPEKRNEHLNVIIQEADRLNNLVVDMLNVARLQSNSVELKKEKFNFVQAAREVIDTFEILNEQDNYNIMPVLCKDTFVVGDEDKIKQVMTNLISNAVKYCGEDKFIKIEIKRVGNKKIRFDVVDHGQGIASDEIAHVWDRYYRTSANRDRNIEGTGLGLSIVKGILSLHNANYGVESKEGEGSDFWFEMDTVRKP